MTIATTPLEAKSAASLARWGASERLASLDAFRGWTMVWIVGGERSF